MAKARTVVVTIMITGGKISITPIITNTIPNTFFFCRNAFKLKAKRTIAPKNSKTRNIPKTMFVIFILCVYALANFALEKQGAISQNNDYQYTGNQHGLQDLAVLEVGVGELCFVHTKHNSLGFFGSNQKDHAINERG